MSHATCAYCVQPAKLNLTLLRELNPNTGQSFEADPLSPWEADGDGGPYGSNARTVPVCCFGMRFGCIDLCASFAVQWSHTDGTAIVDEHGHAYRDMVTADVQPAQTWRDHIDEIARLTRIAAISVEEASATVRHYFSQVPAATDPSIRDECLSELERERGVAGDLARAGYLIGLFDNPDGEATADLRDAAARLEGALAAQAVATTTTAQGAPA